MNTTTTPSASILTFSCHGLEASAFLCARGVRFLGIHPSPTLRSPEHVVFAFDNNNAACEQELLAYESGASIPARQFAIALKMLKDQLFRIRNSNFIKEYTNTYEQRFSEHVF